MALAKELMGLGFSSGQASGIGGGYAAITAVGTVQGDAVAVAAGSNVVAGADGTVGARLPACEVGGEVWIFNNSASTLKLWPDVGAAIPVTGTGLGTANSSYALLTYKTAHCKRVTSTQWLMVVT
jgi:hypothetical protein